MERKPSQIGTCVKTLMRAWVRQTCHASHGIPKRYVCACKIQLVKAFGLSLKLSALSSHFCTKKTLRVACVINFSSLLHKLQDGDSEIIINLSDGDPGTNVHWQVEVKRRNKEEEDKLLRCLLRDWEEGEDASEMVIDRDELRQK